MQNETIFARKKKENVNENRKTNKKISSVREKNLLT